MSGLGTTGCGSPTGCAPAAPSTCTIADHRRIAAQLTPDADSRPLAASSRRLCGTSPRTATNCATARSAVKPKPSELRLERCARPATPSFGPVEEVPLERAAGRVAAEMATPYPPRIPAVLPGSGSSEPVAEHHRARSTPPG
ncbi:hypothetical protein [Streptomyces sp. KL116D]|uniref:Orn/Lys/Arg family decarboxylase n=1 Tax=Streptomyces sp. KL116D TaxID=3045152 RepID=UPI003556FFA3